MPDGEEVYNEKEVASFLIDIISKAEGYGDWRDFEASLGKLDLDEYLGEMALLLDDDNDDDDLFHRAYRNEDAAKHFYRVTIQVKDIFSEWINSISLREAKPIGSFMNLFDRRHDVFLTFNYTSVLEELYQAKNVFHIHGEQNSSIVVGHGENRGEDFYYHYTGSEYYLDKIHSTLRKNTGDIIAESSWFFEGLTDIDAIYSYGFSFSDVDLPYIEKVIKRITTHSVTWYLNDYDNEEKREAYKKIIKSCGFKGKYATFTIV
jgi:hypothetical protein